MRAAVLHAFGEPLQVRDVEIDPPRRGEALVRLAASGVCHSDLHAAQGVHPCPLPAVLGHEGAGVVEQVGDGIEGIRPGDHVILSWLPYCGRCRFCAAGRPNLCDGLAWSDAGTMSDGTTRLHLAGETVHHFTSSTFAELTVVPEQTLIPVDPALPLEQLALLGCAVMTGVGAVFTTARLEPGATAAVVGCGGVGLSVIQGAAIAGASRVIAVDVVDQKLELARELGATDTINAAAQDPVQAVRRIAPGGVDYAFEAVGRPATISTAIELLGKGGTAVLVGMAPPGASVSIDPLTMTYEERTITGCWYGSCRPELDFPRLLELYARGRLRLDPLVSRTCTLDDVNDAFAWMEHGTGARAVIRYGT
jgi:S-(hydroxymethyl)glutathione dehydrogenase/alcohol dehydrogenase